MYILDVPSDYDTNQPYRLFFTWHWLGGSATDVVNGGYYGLKAKSNGTAVFVSPDGLEGGGTGGVSGKGWWNTDGEDVRFLEVMLDHFFENLCIDQGRIFSTGFSFGGMMSNTVGCEKSDVFRAIAPMSGSMMGGCRSTDAVPVAFFGAHGDVDDFVSTQSGRDARDVFVARNHCQDQTQPAGDSYPDYCVEYQGCDEGYPVFWCEFSGGHGLWSGAADPLWNFFSMF
jgi:poly(3-hydroxybutyrate) depolymerase